MERWEDSCVELIYLDPPFNSKVNYNIIYGKNGAGDAQYRAFTDIWNWDDEAASRFEMFAGAVSRPAHDVIVGLHRFLGECGMLAYLTYMAERLEQMHRLLKPTGSIYLHCDPTASHYLKLVMDAIFSRGGGTFRNEIVWCYTGPGSPGLRQFNRKHDTVFWYSKGKKWTFNADDVRIHHNEKTTGNFKRGLRGSGFIDGEYGLADGKIPETWWPQKKGNGLAIVARQKRQYLGYPTQKPLALLERIIKASSNRGDLVLDPFCGCGTAIEAAERLGRGWAGVDISSFAIDLIREKRLKRIGVIPEIRGIPFDLVSARKLSAESPFNFESWAIARIPGFAPNTKQVADGGIDGRATLATKPENFDSRRALAQTKGGRFNLSNFRDFCHVINREQAALGCFITLDEVSSRAALTEAAGFGRLEVSGYPYKR